MVEIKVRIFTKDEDGKEQTLTMGSVPINLIGKITLQAVSHPFAPEHQGLGAAIGTEDPSWMVYPGQTISFEVHK